MTHEDEPRDAALQALFPLDAQRGPAPTIDADAQARLIGSALDQWQAPTRRVVAMPLRTWMMAAAALLMCVAGARAFYVWMQPTPSTTSTPTLAPPVVTRKTVTPTPAPIETPDTVQRAPKPQPAVETDHLLRANRLRADGRYRDAVRAYQRVIATDSGASAYVAKVAAASILLEHLHSPKSARALFLDAQTQRPNDTLEKEIARGITECDKQLDVDR